MPQEINISVEDIRYAEKILLPEGKEFDDERKFFIRNLNTIDLQAVPGSGKTTALLAKLVILEKKLPFSDGSGILVLSHTNAAIDEIKEKIQKHCPKLFSYPNFVGTIQSFVDEFLAIPFYVNKFKKKHIRIDSEIYNEKINNCLEKLWLHKLDVSQDTFTKVQYIKKSNEALFFDFRFLSSDEIKLVKKLNESVLEIKKPKGRTHAKNYNDYSLEEKQQVYNWFCKFKTEILKSGILHFDDAYFLAELYLKRMPEIKTILQKRFPFVFVDEMQDMATHQYNLLEKIFYDEGNSISKYQRIGDKNQAIYNSAGPTEVWCDRANVLRLNSSQRLSKPIADVVKKFALYHGTDFDIVGLNVCTIKPHILIFDNANIDNIIPCFAHIVKTCKENGSLINPDNSVKVICWNTEWKDDDASRQDIAKLRLEDYYKGFKIEKSKPKKDHDCLKSYLLYYDKHQKTLKPLRKNILNAFLKILRLENINTSDVRPYTMKQLIEVIRTKDIQKFEIFNLNLYNWSIGIIKGKTNDVLREIKIYIPHFFAIFSENPISGSSGFIYNDTTGIPSDNSAETDTINQYKVEGLDIEITSVHSVKGQTHCATLYLESFYQKNYESERLTNQFLGHNFNDTRVHHKSSVKMVYVGFSRPTDLLCVAIHKDRFDSLFGEINRQEWEVIEVPK